jgi:hypothetical protein
MPSAKKTAAPAKKTAPVPAKAAPAKAAPAKAPPTKAAPAKALPTKAPTKAAPPMPTKASGKPTQGKPVAALAEGDDQAPVVPKAGLQKVAGRDTLCQIEIVKDGHFFIARTQTEGAADKEYKNTVFEDLLTEMVITLQEQLNDK